MKIFNSNLRPLSEVHVGVIRTKRYCNLIMMLLHSQKYFQDLPTFDFNKKISTIFISIENHCCRSINPQHIGL